MAASVDDPGAFVRVGGMGWITQARAFASFPVGAIGRLTGAGE
jgi:hypothetical protein